MKEYRVVTRDDARWSCDIRGIIHAGLLHTNYSEENSGKKPLVGALKDKEDVTVKMLRRYLRRKPHQLIGLRLLYIDKAGDTRPTSTSPIVEILEINPSDEFRDRPKRRQSLYDNSW